MPSSIEYRMPSIGPNKQILFLLYSSLKWGTRRGFSLDTISQMTGLGYKKTMIQLDRLKSRGCIGESVEGLWTIRMEKIILDKKQKLPVERY